MKKICLMAVVLFVLSGFILAGETLDEILAKNYESRGGLEKLKSIQTLRIRGKMVQSQMNMEMPLELWYQKPNRLRMEATFQGRKIVQGYDGNIAWWIMPFLGTEDPQVMAEDQAREVKEMAESMDPLVDFREKGYRLELVGKEEMEGTEVYRLKMTRKDGKVDHYFLDTESGIELKNSGYRKQGETEVLVETYPSEYQEVDGLVMAFQMEIKINNQPSVSMTFSEYRFNEDMDNALFVMPEKKEAEAEGDQ